MFHTLTSNILHVGIYILYATMVVFFGGLGFLLGISVLNFDFHWKDFTAFTLLVEVLMGVYVFIIFTLEIPIHWGHVPRVGVVGAPSYPLDSFSDHEVHVPAA